MSYAPALRTLAALALLGGCVESSKPTSQEATNLAAYVLDAPPPIPHPIAASFDNKIKLLGYKLEPDAAIAPGKEAKLTLYWQVIEPVGAGWQLFTHLVNERGERFAAGNIDNVGPLRDAAGGKQALPPGDWQRGKVYVDVQTFRIPDDAGAEVSIVTGIWKGDARLPVIGPAGDSERRALVAKIKTGGPAKAAPAPRAELPQLSVPKLDPGAPAPKIDGKLDDPAWQNAAATGAFVDVSTGAPNTSFPVNGSVKALWDDRFLYLGFEITDDKLVGGFAPGDKDPHLWEKECVEIMVDPDGDGDNRDYYEIQISPQNLVFDSQFDTKNQPNGGPNGPFGHQDWSLNAQTAVVVHGTLDKDDDTDQGYTVEAALPWASFAKAKKAPPQPGDTWRVNFYAMKRNSGVAWSPILRQGNFHTASRFGRVTFVAPGAAPAASASASTAASSAPPKAPPAASKK